MASAAAIHVPSLDVRVEGQSLDPTLSELIADVRVRDNVMLPDAALLRLVDPRLERVDTHPFRVGAALEIRTGALEATAPSGVVFTGEVVALEPEFTEGACVIAVRAYDRSHRLHRTRRTRTFQDQTSADIVRKVASEHGLQPGTVGATGGPHHHMQQSAETDWDFCWRLARMHDFEFVVEQKTFHFRRAGSAAGEPVELRYPDNLLSFRPRLSGMHQARGVEVRSHDAATQRPFVQRITAPEHVTATAGADRNGAVQRLQAGDVLIADRVADDAGQARAIAQSAFDHMASAWLEAEGTLHGDPRVRAGAKVRVVGVGKEFSGEYHVNATTHHWRGGEAYRTSFTVSDRSSRGLLDLLHTPEPRNWGSELVIGLVTNVNDPDGMGRVRVSYPSLGDAAEGWWARVAVPHAGEGRGMYMLPQVDDEVIVGFEHGDTRRPYVLGSLFNGVNKPPDPFLEKRRGTFAITTQERAHVESKEEMTIRSGDALTVEADGEIKQTAARAFEIDGATVTIKGTSSISVEASGSLTLKGATVDIEGSGPVNVRGAVINLG